MISLATCRPRPAITIITESNPNEESQLLPSLLTSNHLAITEPWTLVSPEIYGLSATSSRPSFPEGTLLIVSTLFKAIAP
jgi:hypothetical protein